MGKQDEVRAAERAEWGRRLRALVLTRQYDLGLTQERIVSELDMAPATLNRWYAGLTSPDIDALKALAMVLKVDWRWVIDPPPVVPAEDFAPPNGAATIPSDVSRLRRAAEEWLQELERFEARPSRTDE